MKKMEALDMQITSLGELATGRLMLNVLSSGESRRKPRNITGPDKWRAIEDAIIRQMSPKSQMPSVKWI